MDCWRNVYATYQPDREPFYTKVVKILESSTLPTYQSTTGNGTVDPAATKSAHAHLKQIFRTIASLTTLHWQTAWDNV